MAIFSLYTYTVMIKSLLMFLRNLRIIPDKLLTLQYTETRTIV